MAAKRALGKSTPFATQRRAGSFRGEHNREMTPMIAKGSSEEDIALRHILRLQAMIAGWNEDADNYRMVARGKRPAAAWMLREADRTRLTIRAEAELCDQLADNLPPGHELWGEMIRVASALDALSESIAVSAEAMIPRIEHGRDVAGLKYLVGELKKNAALAVSAG
jgi:hypothetical protein